MTDDSYDVGGWLSPGLARLRSEHPEPVYMPGDPGHFRPPSGTLRVTRPCQGCWIEGASHDPGCPRDDVQRADS